MGSHASRLLRCCIPFNFRRTQIMRDKDGHLLKDVQPFPLFSFEAERLSEAVIKGDLDLAESIIVESTTISINERDSHGFTVLFRAIQYSHFDIALMLLELGADPKQKNADGTSCIHIAAQKGDVDLILALHEHGADVQIDCPRYSHSTEEFTCTPMHLAISGFNIDAIHTLLECGVSVHVQPNVPDFIPYIYMCAWLGCVEGLNALFASQPLGFSEAIECSSFRGKNILIVASEMGHLQCVKYIVENSKIFGCEILNAIDGEERTALHYASIHSHHSILKYLIENGANVNVKDEQQRTPIHYACEQENISCMVTLIESGADYKIKDLRNNTPYDLIPNTNATRSVQCAKAYRDALSRVQELKNERRAQKMKAAMAKTINKHRSGSGSSTPTGSKYNVEINSVYLANQLKHISEERQLLFD
ncbi:hypothetical protein AKO1_012309 [Acrasis kona]|uniref:Uncharacterized protein n=1 Tax=Acrasis kona TaxID=1008807 RepID=A0AAW2YX88_9EUKA